MGALKTSRFVMSDVGLTTTSAGAGSSTKRNMRNSLPRSADALVSRRQSRCDLTMNIHEGSENRWRGSQTRHLRRPVATWEGSNGFTKRLREGIRHGRIDAAFASGLVPRKGGWSYRMEEAHISWSRLRDCLRHHIRTGS